MAQTNFTPILIYASSTPTNVPSAGNLTNSATGSEIAINIADKNLFFKDSGGVVNTVPIRQSSTSSNGWLSSTDWNTFNGKAPATSGTSILYGNGSGGFSNVTIGTGITFAGGTLSATGTGGTVTSVTGTSPVVSSGGTTPAISLATAYGDTLNPYASKTANYILAAPNGSAGVPTFRALVAADLPSLSGTYIPYTGASSAIDLNAQTVTNIAHLGINTTSVPTILIRAIGDNNSSSRIAMRGYSSNANSSSIRVTKFRGTFAAPQAPQSGDSLGKFELAGYGTTASDGYPQASYEGLATEAWGATARGTKTVFKVTPNTTTTQVTALTIDQDSTATFASTVTATTFVGSGASLTGVVTSVGATSPVTSSGGTTPTIAMPAATTSVSGYLTSTDWNTFNSKQPAGSYLTAVSIVSANGFAGTSSGGATPALTLSTSITGLLKGNGTAISAATSGTDYAPATSGSSILYGNGAGGFSNVTVGTGLTFIGGTLASTASGGTVTSVAASVPAFLSISGSPITTSGTLAISYSGTALPVANGGTGLTSLTANRIPYGNGTSAFSSSSTFIFDGTSMGIGTTSAGFGTLTLNSYASTPLTTLTIGDIATPATAVGIYFRCNGTSPVVLSTAGAPIAFAGGSSGSPEWMRLHASGGVSIGNTTDPGIGSLYVTNKVISGTAFFNTTSNLGFPTVLDGLAASGSNGVFTFKNDAGNNQWLGWMWNNAAGATSNNLFVAFGTDSTYTNRGSITYNSTAGLLSFNTTSDQRLKTNIVDAPSALDKINAIRIRSFNWIETGNHNDFGVIAQELIEVAPEAVTPGDDAKDGQIEKPWAVDTSALNPAMIKAIQELTAKVTALEEQVLNLSVK